MMISKWRWRLAYVGLLFRRIWRSECNPFVWDLKMVVFGNTGDFSQHGRYYRHRYTGSQHFIPEYPSRHRPEVKPKKKGRRW